jgi:ferrochelatase
MIMSNLRYLIVNFGGPRSKEEIAPFLKELLCDRDVVATPLPDFLHRFFFSRVAKRRAIKIASDYDFIGGKSPIFEDTEAIAQAVRHRLKAPVLTFHRYLPATHAASLKAIRELSCDELRVFPMFPQFSYATTGSIARFFAEHLPKKVVEKMRWVKSYATHPAYVAAMQKRIGDCLKENQLEGRGTLLFFSAHGLPQKFVDRGDIYERECQESYAQIRAAFPECSHLLAYQSKFGRGEWIRPYTNEVCEQLEGPENVIFVPLSFTSDHIETLFEIEKQYLPILKNKGLNALRCPALNREEMWIDTIATIIQGDQLVSNKLLRK